MDRRFEAIEVLLIDGNNLLHRVSGGVDPGAIRLLLAKLRGTIPESIATVVMLDGHAASGTGRNQRVGKGFEIRHSGSFSADDALVRLIHDAPPGERGAMTVVTDDRPLSDRARHLGAHTQRLSWLEALLGIAAPGPGAHIGRPGIRPPRNQPHDAGPRPDDAKDSDDERPSWKPGRGATRKRGNPRRLPR